METRYLHALGIPERVLDQPRGTQSQRVSEKGALNSDVPAVSTVSADAPGQVFAGLVGGYLARLQAAEFEELFGANGIEVVPYHGDTPDPQRDGYYSAKDISVDLPAGYERDLQLFDGRITKQGTRQSHRRAVKMAPSSITNPFGSASSAEVGIPHRASAVKWFDRNGGQTTTDATVQRTVQGEHDQIDIYDATEPPFSTPALVYDVPYEHEWPVDVRVWDDRNTAKIVEADTDGSSVGSATVGSATIGGATTVAWQRCYRTDHDFAGVPILENDRLRVALDTAAGRLRASRWSQSDGQYERVQLDPTSSWRFVRADIEYIGVEAVDARLTFSDGTTTDRLWASCKRGYDSLLFHDPDGSAASGLVDRLDAIAADSDQDPAGTAGIVKKENLGD